MTQGRFPYNEFMIRSITFPRVLGKSLEDLRPALDLFRTLGFAPGNEWHEGGSHGVEMLAPAGGIEFIAAPDAPPVDATVEVSDADAAYEVVKKLVPTVKIRREIHDTPYGARLFDVEVSGLRIGFLTYSKKPGDGRGMGARSFAWSALALELVDPRNATAGLVVAPSLPRRTAT